MSTLLKTIAAALDPTSARSAAMQPRKLSYKNLMKRVEDGTAEIQAWTSDEYPLAARVTFYDRDGQARNETVEVISVPANIKGDAREAKLEPKRSAQSAAFPPRPDLELERKLEEARDTIFEALDRIQQLLRHYPEIAKRADSYWMDHIRGALGHVPGEGFAAAKSFIDFNDTLEELQALRSETTEDGYPSDPEKLHPAPHPKIDGNWS